MIDMLENAASIKADLLFVFLKKLIHEYYLIFTRTLSCQIITRRSSKQSIIQIMHTGNEDDLPRFRKLIQTFLDQLIFTDEKNPSIDQ